MKHQPRCLFLLFVLIGTGIAYGQDPTGPTPKKARTPADYQPRTLKEIATVSAAGEADLDGNKSTLYGKIIPSRVKVTFAGRARPLPQVKKDVLHRWAQLYAGAPEHYTKAYETEFLFNENGREHWLAVRKQSVAQFEKAVKKDDAVELFLIRLGGVMLADDWELLLLVESFQKAGLTTVNQSGPRLFRRPEKAGSREFS